MELKYIKEANCSECGATPVYEEISNSSHSNGTRLETRRFSCGCTIQFSPNFLSCSFIKLCPRSKSEVEKIKERKLLISSITEVINASNVDDSFKQRIIEYLPRVN